MIRLFAIMTVLCGLVLGCAQRAPSGGNDQLASDDKSVVTMVHSRLRDDPVTSRLSLGVESADGIVTLNGRIDNAAMRMRAVGIVRGTPGVRGVIDKTVQF